MENAQGQHTHVIIRIEIHTVNATGLLGGVRGDLTFVFERDPDALDGRFGLERERGLRTGLLGANELKPTSISRA